MIDNLSRQIDEMIAKGVCVVCKHRTLINGSNNMTQCYNCKSTFIRGNSS